MLGKIQDNPEVAKECYQEFVRRAATEYGYNIAYINVVKRCDSAMHAETKSDYLGRIVPILQIYVKEDSLKKEDPGFKALWKAVTKERENEFDLNEYYDKKMYVTVFSYEGTVYHEYVKDHRQEISDYLYGKVFARPSQIYQGYQPDGITVVFTPEDYAKRRIDKKEEELRKGILRLIDIYVLNKYMTKMEHEFYIDFKHPDMPGFNGYHLFLG